MRYRGFESLSLRFFYLADAAEQGEMTEWPKVHAWKACVPLKGTEGSNPSLSECSPSVLMIRFWAISSHPTPSGPEGSSGK